MLVYVGYVLLHIQVKLILCCRSKKLGLINISSWVQFCQATLSSKYDFRSVCTVSISMCSHLPLQLKHFA